MDRSEITEIIAGLKKKRRFRGIDDGKLAALLDGARFTPAPLPYDRLLERIKREAKDGAPAVKPLVRFPVFLSPRVLIPAIAALVIAVASPFLWNFYFSSVDVPAVARCDLTFGEVSLVRNGSSVRAGKDSVFQAGDVVVTGGKSFADFSVGGDVRVRVKENSRLSFDSLSRSGHGGYQFAVEIPRGMIYFNFIKLASGDTAEVRTPTSVAQVRGTSFGVQVDDRANSRFEVQSGKIRVRPRVAPAGLAVNPAATEVLERMERDDAPIPGVVVEAGQACAVSHEDHEKILERIEPALKSGNPGIIEAAVRDMPAPVAERASGESRMLGEIGAFSREAPGRTAHADIIELVVDVSPDDASVYLDGDLKGKGDITLLTRKGVHRIVVKADNHVDRAYEAPFTDSRNTLRIGLDSIRRAAFDFRAWASSRDASLVAYLESDGILLSVGRNGMVEAVARGTRRWSTDLKSAVTAPLIWDNSNIYLATSQESIVALARGTGKVRWTRPINGHLLFGSGMEYHDGHIYAGTSKGFLYRISDDGNIDWVKELGAGIFVPPFASGKKLFVAANDGSFRQVNIDDGSVTAQARLGKIIGGTREVRGDLLYLANMEGEVVCYNHALNRELWRYGTGARMVHGPVVDGEGLFAFTVAGDVHRVDLSGGMKWKVKLGNRIDMNPVVRGSEVFIISERVLYVLDGGSGGVKWSYVIDARPTTPVVVAGEKIMFGAEGKGLVVLRRD
jgi:outer membrane protein assembly factor BamB